MDITTQSRRRHGRRFQRPPRHRRERLGLPRIVGEILNDGSKKILLNLSDMDYIDSNGLGELVQVFRESKRGGASLRLLKPHDRVARRCG
jgi:ABC-type transporter Mla MlaB component